MAERDPVLPFILVHDPVPGQPQTIFDIDWWNVEPTGVDSVDRETGRRFANIAIAYQRASDAARVEAGEEDNPYLGCVVAAAIFRMIVRGHLGPIEWEFVKRITAAAARGSMN